MPFSPGDKLGPYEIAAAIGKGGMGEVYRAHDPRLQRDVAIKVSAQRFNERFEREARAVAALNHPNICQIYDVGPNYLVMELIEGPTLRDVIKTGALPLDEALRIANQIAEALATAHEKRITHRDLKPANIKVKEDGTVKVLDFGLAKIGNTPTAGDSEESPTLSMSLTKEGMILGTAAYMSPEQARGKHVDERADIWAFGVVLYEMLTGRRLFRGDDITETLASVLKETPNLNALPRKARRLVDACLQKDPKQRLQAIGDRHLLLVDAEPQARGWLWPALAGAVTLVTAALAWTHFREAPATAQSLRYQLTRASEPSGNSGFAQFQLSRDGRYIAFIARSGAADQLFVRALDSLEEREFPGTDGARYPFWSPDTKHIAFFSQGKLKQVALEGGPVTNIADAPDARGGAWGADGTIVFAPAVTGTLLRVPAAGGGPATPLDLPRPEKDDRDSLRFPAFIGDSDRFFYTIEAPKREGEGIYAGSLSGAPPVRILPDFSTTRFVPSPGSETNGFILFRRDTTLMAQPFDAENLKTTGEPFRVADQVPDHISANTANSAFTVSANGTLMYLSGAGASQEREAVWLDRGGKRGKSLLKQKGLTDFALSPNNAQLAYSLSTQRVAGDLWLLDVARGASQRFTFGPFNAFTPVWSPDNTALVFTAYPEDALYRKGTQTSAKEEALRVVGTNTFARSWSADGKWLVFSQNGVTTKSDIWLLPMQGDHTPKLFKQTPFSETEGQISPDGRWMAYESDASGRFEIYLESLAASGAQRQVSVAGGVSPRWRSDGRELYFISGQTMMAVSMEGTAKQSTELTFGAPHELFREPALFFVAEAELSYQVSADGSRFLVPLTVGDASTVPPLTVVTNWLAAYGK
jgi:Tol biopolymer transport system component/predicted Ser/Thr protein kinase